MPDRAKITSLDALENFRSRLIVYLEKAARAVDEIDDEVTSTRLWLQSDRRVFWEAQVRQRTTTLDLRQQELFSAQISSLQTDALVERMAVQKAKRALEEATAKLTLVKQHNREYDNRVGPLAKEVEKVRSVLNNDMRKAVASLTQVIKTLSAYAETKPPATVSAPPAPADSAPSVVQNQPDQSPAAAGGKS